MRVTFDDLSRLSDLALVDGGFDPLHAGHVQYLQAAHQFSGVPPLVSIASDADIRAKGREPLLSAEQRAAVLEALSCVTAVHIKDRPTEAVLEQLRPKAYIKGADWAGKLPPEQVDVCARYGIPIHYTDAPADSSSRLLADWSVRNADRQLDTLEAYMAAQAVTPPERYDREYFEGQWRTTAPAYTLEARRKAEGRHPKILKELFGGMSILDVGCGPGFLVQMLRELGMDAGGIDPSYDAVQLSPLPPNRIAHASVESLPPKIAQVVICREVLEHLTVAEVAVMVAELFRVARKAVYITTRFHPSPRSVFDVTDERDVDPTHATLLTQPLLRALCVLNGGRRNREWESALDHQQKGRVLCYEV